MTLILCLALYGLLLYYTVKIAREEGFSVLLSILGTLVLGPLMLLFILLRGRRKQFRRNTRRRDRRNTGGGFSMPSRTPGDVEDWIEECQKGISALLYISLIAHGVEVFLNDVGVLAGVVPVLQVISAVAALLFFLGECVLLPPVGVLIMTALAAVLFFVIPYFVGFLAGLFVGSFLLMVVGGLVAVLSTSLIIFVSNGLIVGAVIAPVIVAPFALGFGATAATAVAGTGVAAAVHAGVQKITPGELFHPRRVLINLLMLFVLIWPTLTWFGVCPGMFALKPVQRAQQQHLSFSEKYTSATYKASIPVGETNFPKVNKGFPSLSKTQTRPFP